MLDLTEVHFKQGYFRFENYRLLLSILGFANSFITDLRQNLQARERFYHLRMKHMKANTIYEHSGKEKEKQPSNAFWWY